MMLVSLAGPVMNLLLALAGLVLLKVLWPYQLSEWGRLSTAIISPLVSINIILAAFNLIPLPPWMDPSTGRYLPDAGARLMYSWNSMALYFIVIDYDRKRI